MLAKGQIVAGYRIDGVVGRGSLGVVYEATDLKLDRKVALKIVSSELADDKHFRDHFRRQAPNWAVLDHPNILPVYEAGEAEGSLYIAMRYVDGPSLKDLIDAASLDERRSLRLLGQVAAAVDAAHRVGLAHGDIKPENVLVGAGDHAYLTDLGVPRRGELTEPYLTRAGAFVGTVDYMSPELIRGQALEPASDVYELTAVLYECLTREVPYPRASPFATALAHMEERRPSVTALRPDLPRALDDVVAEGMAKDPHDRPQHARDLVRAAEEALNPDVPKPPYQPGAAAPSEDRTVETTVKTMLRTAARAGVVPATPALQPAAPAPAPSPFETYPPPAPAPYIPYPEPVPTEAPAPSGRRPFTTPLVWIGVPLAVLGVAAVAAKWLLDLFVIPIEPATAPADPVECTVFAPPFAPPGDSLLVQAFVHLPEQADDARAIASELDTDARRRTYRTLQSRVTCGSRLDLELRLPGLDIDDPVASLVWRGRAEAVQFGVGVPENAREGTVIGTLDVSLEGAPIGHLKFKLSIERGAAHAEAEPQGESARRYTAAFISYASADRDKVLERVQMLSIAGIRYFQDVLDLEPGDRWLKKLELGIDEADLFLLFWSNEAKQSRWVREEVAYALARKAGDDLSPPEIRPVIIEGPPIVAPWEELAHLHFNDKLVYFLNR